LADNANCHAEAARRSLWKLGENALFWAREEESAGEAVAQLTTVDGAVFVDRDLKVISFGAKLVAPNIEEQVTCWSPVENVDVIKRPLDKLGGTRHQSAVRFVALWLVQTSDVRCWVWVSGAKPADQGSRWAVRFTENK